MPRIYAYVVTHDYGFAPNPYEGFCTLATCKPQIRRTAKAGDWLVGSASTKTSVRNALIYAAKIDRIVSWEEYGALPEFEGKRPTLAGPFHRRHGDNIHYRDAAGWQMRRNAHHTSADQARDLRGRNVLIAHQFWYFGTTPYPVPDDLLHILQAGRGHKCTDSPYSIQRLEAWLNTLPLGISGAPAIRSDSQAGTFGCSVKKSTPARTCS